MRFTCVTQRTDNKKEYQKWCDRRKCTYKMCIRDRGTTLRIILPQELDQPMADLIRKGTEMIAGRTYIRTIVFDFSETEFMDSSGIGLLMGRYRALGMRKDCICLLYTSRCV